MENDLAWKGLVLGRLYEAMDEMQVCHCQRQGRMGEVRCGARCRQDLLYRLKSVGGKVKGDDHFLSRSSDVCDGWYCRDAGILLVLRWSGVLHGLRGVKGCM